jgi:CRISPR-associated Csx2 family protein
MAKILISPVGKGPILDQKKDNNDKGNHQAEKREYKRADYQFSDSDKVYKTPFIAAALAEHLKVDKIFMIGTNKSMGEEVYHYFGEIDHNPAYEDTYFYLINKIGGPQERSILENGDLNHLGEVIDQYLKNRNPQATGGSICKIIKYGITEQELYDNLSLFMDLVEKIQPGDELVLDITHSFRSLPMFMYLLVDFMRNLRKEERIILSGIYYGMVDASHELGYAPVVDLKPFFMLSEWSKGVHDFINYGNVNLMAELFPEGEAKEVLNNMAKLTNLNHIKQLRQEMDRFRHSGMVL